MEVHGSGFVIGRGAYGRTALAQYSFIRSFIHSSSSVAAMLSMSGTCWHGVHSFISMLPTFPC